LKHLPPPFPQERQSPWINAKTPRMADVFGVFEQFCSLSTARFASQLLRQSPEEKTVDGKPLLCDKGIAHEIQKEQRHEKYITKVIGNSKNILMVDTGYQGTTQYNIEKTYELKFKGRYITYKENPLLEDVKGFYDFYTHKLKDNIIFLESVLTDKVGTYIDIVNGEFITEQPSQNQKYFNDKIEIVNGIKKFTLDMFDSNEITSKTNADYMFDLMCTNGYIKNESLFNSFFHDNQYTRDIVKKINLNQ